MIAAHRAGAGRVGLRSSSVASTRTAPRGLRAKLYHSSIRVHRRGKPTVEGWRAFSTLIAPMLNLRVILEVGAEETAVPRPVVLRVRRGMHSGKATARSNETL